MDAKKKCYENEVNAKSLDQHRVAISKVTWSCRARTSLSQTTLIANATHVLSIAGNHPVITIVTVITVICGDTVVNMAFPRTARRSDKKWNTVLQQ